MKRIFLLIVAFVALFSVDRAVGAVTFKTDVPMFITMGETVRVSFNLNAEPDDKVVAPSFDNFDVLAGPTLSQGKSVQIVNGQRSSSVSYTTTYLLLPKKVGTFTIGSASVTVGGKKYTTKPVAVEVRAAGASAASAGTSTNQPAAKTKAQSPKQQAANRIENSDLMLRMELSSNSVYKGEPLRATLRLYTRVDIASVMSSKLPTFEGFWNQPLEVSQEPSREILNGKVYQVFNVASYLLYPQQDGTLTIGPTEMTVAAQVEVKSQPTSEWDLFFGAFRDRYTITKALYTPEIKVPIKPFPADAPASFAGAVGEFTLSHELSASEVEANSAMNLKLKVSGNGNLSFITAPKLTMPTSFEVYDVKNEENIQVTASGTTGSYTFEYPFIVRAEGDYEIEPIEFTYFSPAKGEYVTLATPTMNIKVTPDTSGSSSKSLFTMGGNRENVMQLGQDIRFIKLGDPALRSVVAPFIFSPIYWAVAGAMLLLALLCYLIVRKHIRDNRNAVLVKGKRANRVAVKRFRVAEKYMRAEDRRSFYEEMLRALWGYLSDRFNIPVADLTREVVREELSRRGALTEAEQVIAVIARCEEAQYSPIETAEMSTLYKEGVEAVSKIEKIAK